VSEVSPHPVRTRYRKLRRLCRELNRNRRRLREKVDLLCRDLVQSNVALTRTVQDLRRAYEFQTELVGEFDQRYMLHKALRLIRREVFESSAALYLTTADEFAAHLTSAWYDDARDIAEIEQALRRSVVPVVRKTGRRVLVPDATNWTTVAPALRKLLAGLSILALPVLEERELLGVMVLYRDATRPLTDRETHTVESFIPPLARALSALQRLRTCLADLET